MKAKLTFALVIVISLGVGSTYGDIMDGLVWLGHFNGDSVLPDLSSPATTLDTNTAATTGATGYPFVQTPQAALAMDGAVDHMLRYNYNGTGDLRYHGTMSAWIQPDVLQTQVLFGTTRATNDTSHYAMLEGYGTDGTQMRLYTQSGSGSTAWNEIITLNESQYFETDTWTHVALTWSGTDAKNDFTVKIYVDGVLQSTLTDKYFPLYFGTLYLGSNPTNILTTVPSLDGQLDEAAIWNKALSDTEITTVYNQMISGYEIPEPMTLGLLATGSILLMYKKR